MVYRMAQHKLHSTQHISMHHHFYQIKIIMKTFKSAAVISVCYDYQKYNYADANNIMEHLSMCIFEAFVKNTETT